MRLSMNKVNETGFLMHFVFLLLISVIPFLLIDMVSAVIPFLLVLKFLLPPFQAGCLASLYIDQFHTLAASTFPGPGNEPVSENGITPPSGQEEVADHSATAAEKNITESSDETSDLEHNKKIDGIDEIQDENREDGLP